MLMLYLHVFCDSIFSLEIFSTHLTLICFKCLLHMKKHLYEVIPVTFVERSSRLNGTWKNISKKSTYIILVPSQRYQDFWQLLQNPKVPKIVLGFSNHAQRFTPPYYLDVDNPFKNNLRKRVMIKQIKLYTNIPFNCDVCQEHLYTKNCPTNHDKCTWSSWYNQ